MLETFVKTYGDRKYLHTALLRHKGVLVAFALDDRRRMLYSVLDPTAVAARSAPPQSAP